LTNSAETDKNQAESLEGIGALDFDATVEELQSEIIVDCLEQWRTFKRTNRNKRIVIDVGVKIFDMLMKYKAQQTQTLDLRSKIKALAMMGVPILDET